MKHQAERGISGGSSVVAAEERCSDAIDRVEDAVAVALIRWNPIIVARCVGCDCKIDGIFPPCAGVAQAIAPSANAILKRQRIEAVAALWIADEIGKVSPPPVPGALCARRVDEPASIPPVDITLVMCAADLPMMDSPFWRRGRPCDRVRCKCERRDDRENPYLPAGRIVSPNILCFTNEVLQQMGMDPCSSTAIAPQLLEGRPPPSPVKTWSSVSWGRFVNFDDVGSCKLGL